MLEYLKTHKESILAAVAGLVLFLSIGYWLTIVYDRNEKITVVAAAKDLTAPKSLTEEDLIILKLPRGNLPATAIADLKAIVGATLLHPLSRQEVITVNDLTKDYTAGAESLLLKNDTLGFSVPSAWLAGPTPKLTANDYVTVLASAGDRPVNTGTSVAGQHLKVIKVDNDRDGLPSRILLEVSILEAAQILQARANRLVLSVLVEPANTK